MLICGILHKSFKTLVDSQTGNAPMHYITGTAKCGIFHPKACNTSEYFRWMNRGIQRMIKHHKPEIERVNVGSFCVFIVVIHEWNKL